MQTYPNEAHAFGKAQIEKETDEFGTKYWILWECEICGYKKYLDNGDDPDPDHPDRPAPIVHVHDTAKIIDTQQPTCTEPGYLPGLKCGYPDCGEILIEPEYAEPLGHLWRYCNCLRCGETQLEMELSANGAYYIVKGIGSYTGSILEIPGIYNGLYVTEIGSEAFLNCTQLTSVIISDSVTRIGFSAFYNCTSLIQKENGVSYVDKWVVDCDTSVTSVTLRADTVGIADDAFYYCTSLTSINIPASVKSIGKHAFEHCTSLASVTFAEGSQLTSIGREAFDGCTALASIEIPASVTSIGYDAFSHCTSLASVTFAAGSQLTSIGEYAFSHCTSLTSIVIPASVTSIGSYAFSGCIALASVTFAEGSQLTSIGYGAFYNCTSLTSIEIPASVTSIGGHAFSGCTALASVTIPASVTSIGYDAFSHCTSLASVTFENHDGWWVSTSSSASSGTSVNVSDPATAATLLKSTYCYYYWKRS